MRIEKTILKVLIIAAVSVLACSTSREPEPSKTDDTGNGSSASISTPESSNPSEKSMLRILYAGHPKSEREKDFVDFLMSYFDKVETADLAKFSEESAAGFDVVILDYDGDGFKTPFPKVPETYSRPTVTVGVAGALMCGRLRLKTGYL